ncbi:MAG: ribosome maturation factor RimP [Candidatus Nanopelagicales bacterium]|jgi:ribosome maturation factor RimP
MTSNNRVAELVAPLVEKRGIDLEEVVIKPAGRRSIVQIFIDRDGGVDLDLVAEVSREISDLLDSTDVLGNNPYTLDVGSMGVDRPLTLPRHFKRNIGRLVEVELSNGSSFVDRILEADEGNITFSEGKAVKLDEVKQALVQVEFSRAE